MKTDTEDIINKPRHYTMASVECIDAIEAAAGGYKPQLAFLAGNIIKYVWRAPLKNGREDLKKARWYLDRLIDRWSQYMEEADDDRA